MAGALACGGGGADVGESCATVADCASGLQCLDHICRPGCLANIDCGDGRVCEDRTCRLVETEIGHPCQSEAQCGPGQTCRLDPDGFVTNLGTCQLDRPAGAVFGEACQADDDCRFGACALGRCTPLCEESSECLRGFQCTGVPRVSADATGLLGGFRGCLPNHATLSFEVPLTAKTVQSLWVPVASSAVSMVLVAEAAQPDEPIGITRLADSGDRELFATAPPFDNYYTARLRHRPLPGIAVLQIPSTSSVQLDTGAYKIDLSSFPGPRGGVTLAGRRLRVVEKLGTGATLDIHFHFADLSEHPCLPIDRVLDATTAPSDPGFKGRYLARLQQIFADATIAVGSVTYEATAAPVEMQGLTAATAPALFATSTSTTGVDVYLVRTLAPAGLEVLVGGTPGAPLPGTRASGVAIAITGLCNNTDPAHRDDPAWERLARVTAHAIARHVGLFRNREPDSTAVDPIVDSPQSDDNLMYWGEDGGTNLSLEQRDIVRASPVLR